MLWLAIVLLAAALAAAAVTAAACACRRRPMFVPRRWPRQHALPELSTPTIESVAANLRRLRGVLDVLDDPTPTPGKATKFAAANTAYERLLCDACRALDVGESLASTAGIDHEAERLRVEAALQECGLAIGRPRRRAGN